MVTGARSTIFVNLTGAGPEPSITYLLIYATYLLFYASYLLIYATYRYILIYATSQHSYTTPHSKLRKKDLHI